MVTLITSLVTLGVGIAILADFDYDVARLQFEVNESWIDVINSRYHLGIDGISLPLLVLTMLVTVMVDPPGTLPRAAQRQGVPGAHPAARVGMNGTFVAQDLILFFIFFEIVLLPMFFMIGVARAVRTARDARRSKFFLFTLFGSAMMLLSFLAIFFLSDVQTFDIPELAALHGDGIVHGTQVLLFAGLFLGVT